MTIQTHARRVASKRRMRGFTLMEIMIAVLVLSIGLLGLAGLQATGMRANHSAYLRSQATILAYDIIESMRANMPFGNVTPAYAIGMCAAPAGGGVAQADLTTWTNNLTTLLPSGCGSIALNGNVATVIVQWDDSRGAEDPLQLSVQTQL